MSELYEQFVFFFVQATKVKEKEVMWKRRNRSRRNNY